MYTGSQGDMSQQDVPLCSWMWQAFSQSWPGGSHDIRVPKKTITMQVLQEELPSGFHTGHWYPWQLLCMFDTMSGSDHACGMSSDLAHTTTTALAKCRHCWLVLLYTLYTLNFHFLHRSFLMNPYEYQGPASLCVCTPCHWSVQHPPACNCLGACT